LINSTLKERKSRAIRLKKEMIRSKKKEWKLRYSNNKKNLSRWKISIEKLLLKKLKRSRKLSVVNRWRKLN
jgi:hypothetical protein